MFKTDYVLSFLNVIKREDLERSLAVEQVNGLFTGSFQFPLAEAFFKRIKFLETKEDSLKKFVAVRPQPNLYSSLYNVSG